MSWRYRQRRIVDGDVITPEDWVLNNKELAEEFNGYLDRDNFPPEVFTTTYVSNGTFSKVRNVAYGTADVFRTIQKTTEWHSVDASGDQLGILEFDCPVDCLLQCEFGATWDERTSPNGAEIRFRITVDGVSVADGGWLSGLRAQWGMHILGAMPVTAGKHTVRAEVQVAQVSHKDTNNYYAVGQAFDVNARELVVVEKRR